jgi:hypothetical protein
MKSIKKERKKKLKSIPNKFEKKNFLRQNDNILWFAICSFFFFEIFGTKKRGEEGVYRRRRRRRISRDIYGL